MVNYHGQNVAWANRSVQTRRVDFGRVKYIPGGECGPRRQRDYEVVLLLEGSARVTVSEDSLELRPEEVVLFRPGHREHFRFATTGETQHVWCSIRPSFMPEDLRRRLDRAPGRVPCSAFLHRLFAAALGLHCVGDASAGRVVEYLGLTVFAEYLHLAAVAARTREQQDECLGRAMAYVEEHYGEEDCLEGARRAACCSESGLNQRFRRYLGTSLARYLWATRVERGVALLRNTGLTVAEISDRCGCKNPFHFSRLVRKSLGQSPRAVRRAAWR